MTPTRHKGHTVTGCTQDNLSVSVTTNNQLSSTGFSYDAAGNMTGDNTYTYGYNAESEIKSAAGVNYTYDGDGNRLEKSSGKIYWYGAGTEILDESDLSGNFANEYVFFGGRRIAIRSISSGTIDYYEEDMLGSSRTMVQAGGTSPCFDADFLPFGYEKDVVTTCTQNYKFEGKERDTETLNDDFGARYYTFRLGRWLSADWSSVPAPVPYANLSNPQTLNLYAMVSDNPESFADLDGHTRVVAGDCVGGNSGSSVSNSGSNVNPNNNPNNNTTVAACAATSSAAGCPNTSNSGSTPEQSEQSGNQATQNAANDQTAQNQNQSQTQQVTITYDKNVPAMEPKTQEYVEKIANAAGVDSINISATTNGEHASNSNHYNGTAVDINKVNGERVVNAGKDPSVAANVRSIQNAANNPKNGSAHENYGPAGLFKNGKQITNQKLQSQHQNHIHITIPRNTNGDH